MNLVKCVVFSRASQMTQVKNVPTVQEMQGMWIQSLGRKDPLEEGMAAHSSVLAWRIPWAEETDKPRSIDCGELEATEHARMWCFPIFKADSGSI